MLVEIRTDSNIDGGDALTREVEALVQGALDRFRERVTRVAVHLSDQSSDKKAGTDDIRCLLEARLAGLEPLSVSHRAATPGQAVDGAAEKLKRSLESTLGRLDSR